MPDKIKRAENSLRLEGAEIIIGEMEKSLRHIADKLGDLRHIIHQIHVEKQIDQVRGS